MDDAYFRDKIKFMENTHLADTIQRYKQDPESVYHTWFINNEDRLKAFRSIRRGVSQVVRDIRDGGFGNDFKGSSLEFVLNVITEQKQVFEGAAHPFYWKPKLRIPDIYESEANKLAFGAFLETCLNAKSDDQIIREIIRLDALKIKGLGPAVASILYFLHPTLIPPFNTAIVNGFNSLFNDRKKLGSWTDYLLMREAIVEANERHKNSLSNDLGAFAGMLFDIGVGKIIQSQGRELSSEEVARIEKQIAKRHREVRAEETEDDLHAEMQYHLLKIGHSLGYDVIAAANDRSKNYRGNAFSAISLKTFPEMAVERETLNTIGLIDVVWFEKGTNRAVAAFEVEKSTSIYSGILRLSDLALSFAESAADLFLVIPGSRERDVILQLTRPSIKNGKLPIQYVVFNDLRENCDAICRLGDSHKIMNRIAKCC
jgi:type II restriction enzyme